MSKRTLAYIFCIVLLLIPATNIAQGSKKNTNPKIGLVLSGGGARGFAHIGVLKVLEEEGIDVDFIGGTSMGSIVGGLYAMGYSVQDIAKLAKTQDWDYVLNDRINRKDIGFYEKYEAERHILSLALKGRKISIPPGLVYGQNVTHLLTSLTNPAFQNKSFNDLEKPFLCMATDLLSGKAIKLDTGNLALAIRASMSVPSAFAPLKYGPYYLVDGGVLNNFPAQYVKDLGADYLIGVDIQTPLYQQDEIDNLVKVLSQSIFLNGEAIFQENLKLIDFLIKPPIDPFTALDFDRADSLIKRGENYAKSILPQLHRFLDSIGYEQTSVRGAYNSFPEMDMLYVDYVEFQGNHKVSDKYLSKQLDIHPDDEVSLKELDQKINRLYGTKLFHTIFYELKYTEDGKTAIYIKMEEAASFEVNVGAHYNDYTKAGLLLNLTSRNLGFPNGRLSIDLALGKIGRLNAAYVVDNGLIPGFGFEVSAFSQYGYVYSNDKKEISFDLGVTKNTGYGLMTFNNIMRFRAGYILEENKISQNVSFIQFDDLTNVNISVFADYTIDTYDRLYFPNKGFSFYSKFDYGAGNNTDIYVLEDESILYFDNEYTYSTITADIRGVVNLSKNFSLIPGLYFRKIVPENVSINRLSFFGGFQKTYVESYLPFPGYDFMELDGHTAIFPSLKLRYNFLKNNYIFLKGNLLSLDLNLDKGIDENELYSGFHIGYSYYSPFGPITLSMAKAFPRNKYVFDISIGFWF